MMLVLIMGFINTFAQPFQKTQLGIKTSLDGNDVEVQFYSPSIVRIIKAPKGKTFLKESLSVVLSPSKTSFAASQKGNIVTLKSSKINVTLDLINGNIQFSSAKGQNLLKEKSNGTKFTPFDDTGVPSYNVYQSFTLDQDEPIYGLGQHQSGILNQRNHQYHLEQGNVEDAVTFFQSVKGYGLFWDNYSPTEFTDNVNETSFKSQVGDGVDYYFMYGGSADGVIANMRELTGKVPMFPLWTYGFWQSKERYKSQDELLNVVKKYRELGVPLDGIIQDWQYWGNNYLWNAMDFLNSEFPNGKKMADDVHAQNAHLIIRFGLHLVQNLNHTVIWIKKICFLILPHGRNQV